MTFSAWKLRCRPPARGDRRCSSERFIATALSANAKAIISYDQDLLALEKPFGIPILRPAGFLLWMKEHY
jgi:predicted nucleic acid-binding protein